MKKEMTKKNRAIIEKNLDSIKNLNAELDKFAQENRAIMEKYRLSRDSK